MTRRKSGIILVLLALAVWLADYFSQAISSLLGKMLCGDRYMLPVGGVTGDVSCGFNADMYLFVFLVVVLLAGIALIVSSTGSVSS